MNRFMAIDWIAFILLIVGGVNWLLIGLFEWNLVTALLGDMSVVIRVIYTLVGLSAIWMLSISGKFANK